jgi:hypothetical protein
MAEHTNRNFCAMLRTKNAYSRSESGARQFDPDSSTACYTCVLTQRPFGPDGMPANTEYCGHTRACFKPEN